MTERAKKLKAAISAVLYYIQEEEKAKAAKPQNRWSRFSRESIMHNRAVVQRRGRVIAQKRV